MSCVHLQDFSGARVNRPLTITELSADALAAEVGRQDAAAAEALTARAAGLLLTGLPPQHAINRPSGQCR